VTALELREEEDGTFVAWWNREAFGRVRLEKTNAQVLTRDAPPRAACDALLDELEARGAETLRARALLLRHVARQRGYTGALRAALVRGDTAPGDLVTQVSALLPDVAVHLAPHGRLRGVVASLVSGLADMTRLRAQPQAGGPVITAAVPDRAELNAEAVAMALDVTLAVHARFGPACAHVTTISFDHSSHGMATGRHAGEAARQLGEIHVNANFVLTQGIDAGWRSAPPAALPASWTSLDATTAHELWHKIELAWETEHYAQSVEFRRALGGLFGRETLEKVFADDAGLALMAERVSDYAATNRVEATAEMFKRYWCGPPPKDSVPEQFGSIVDRFF
jgi:hypothetical protein